MEDCKYCNGNWKDRESLMKNSEGDYYVKINNCNYLEDNKIGDFGQKFSLFGIKIDFCPKCGRKLGE